MDTRRSAALDSLAAWMRADLCAIRDSALAFHKAMDSIVTAVRHDLALFRHDLALDAGDGSDPAPTISDDTQSLDLGHPGLQEDYNPPRIPSSIEVHSVPPLLPSFPLLQAMANPAIKPQSTAYFAARDPKMATTVELLPVLMCSEAAESIDVGHPKLQHLATQDGDGNPLRIPSTVHDHSIPPLLSASPMLQALATSAVTPHSNNSAASIVLLPESKTMTSAPQLLYKHSFFDTTKTGLEDKGGGSQFQKMQLKIAVAEIKLLRNKRQVMVKQLRRDIALLPQVVQDATARI